MAQGGFGNFVAEVESAGFVGRESSLRHLRQVIEASRRAPRIVSVIGPGGVGKTTLVKRAVAQSIPRGHRAIWLRGESAMATSSALLDALAAEGIVSPEALGNSTSPDILVLDAFENLTVLEPYVFESLLPRAGACLCVVVTSRTPLSTRLLASALFQSVHTTLSIENFDAQESTEHLSRAGVPVAAHPPIIEFTEGHPLSLALVAAQYHQGVSDFARDESQASVVHQLFDGLLRGVVEPTRRDCLYLLALLRSADTELFGAVLGVNGAEAEAIGSWVAGLPFVSCTVRGFSLHSLIREALERILGERHPATLERLARRAAESLLDRARDLPIPRQRELLIDVLFANRHAPAVRDILSIRDVSSTTIEHGTGDEIDQVIALVKKHQGPHSALLVERYAALQPANLYLLRDSGGDLSGVIFLLDLASVSASSIVDDAVAQECLRIVRATSHLSGAATVCFRAFVTRSGLSPFAPEMAALMVSAPLVMAQLSQPPSYCFFAMPDAHEWSPLTRLFPLDEVVGASAVVDGKEYGFFVTDLVPLIRGKSRREAHHELLMSVVDRMLDGTDSPRVPKRSSLSRDSFEVALREILRNLALPHQLTHNPLCVDARFGVPGDPVAGVERLKGMISGLCDVLDETPKTASIAEVIRATYLGSATTQQAAAESLAVAFGTYRYRLRKAEAYVTDALWSESNAGSR